MLLGAIAGWETRVRCSFNSSSEEAKDRCCAIRRESASEAKSVGSIWAKLEKVAGGLPTQRSKRMALPEVPMGIMQQTEGSQVQIWGSRMLQVWGQTAIQSVRTLTWDTCNSACCKSSPSDICGVLFRVWKFQPGHEESRLPGFPN